MSEQSLIISFQLAFESSLHKDSFPNLLAAPSAFAPPSRRLRTVEVPSRRAVADPETSGRQNVIPLIPASEGGSTVMDRAYPPLASAMWRCPR
jgi:hypothetical protein